MQDNLIVFPEPSPGDKAQVVTAGLPVSLTSLIGREHEVQALHALLLRPEIRLLTLTGTAGVGKTRLALEVVRDLMHDFTDGVHLVSLAPISDPALVIPTIAHRLGLIESGSQPLLDLLKISQRGKQRLLLLDNFEQVISAAPLLAELLEACSQLKLLVTSREVLRLRGEHQFAVPPLALPDPRHLPNVEALAHVPAVNLFLQRAQAIQSDFHATTDNAGAIAAICLRLDGLPLAIELAAARIKLFPPQALLARLSQRLTVLTSGARDAPARHQTLRHTIKWSYDLLSMQEQRLFRRLAVFVGGCTLEAIEAIGAAFGDEAEPVVDAVASLLDKSVLQYMEQEGGEPRLMMLETIREYGWEALVTSGEVEVIQRAHAAYYLALAEKAEPELTSAEKRRWLERLKREHENLRAALAWLGERKEWEAALRHGSTLWRFWLMGGYYSEGRAELARALAAGEERIATSVRAKALCAAGALANVQADFEQGEALCGESLALFRAQGDLRGCATSLTMLGHGAWQRSDYAAARALLEEAVTLCREVNDRVDITLALINLATVFLLQGEYDQVRTLGEGAVVLSRERGDTWDLAHALRIVGLAMSSQGDLTQAHALLEESLALARQEGYKGILASSLFASAQVALLQGDVALARSLLDESLALFKELGDRQNVAQSLFGLGWISFVQGDYAATRALLEESLALFIAVGNKWFIALCLVGFGALAIAQGEWTWAARLSGAAEVQCQAINGILPPTWRTVQASTLAAARAQLKDEAFSAACAEGRTMTPEQALAAQGLVTMPTITPRGPSSVLPTRKVPAYPTGLTAREVEVLRLVAQGMTNEQMAKQLVISPRTVNTHLTSIFSKIGVSTRSAATRYALDHHLI